MSQTFYWTSFSLNSRIHLSAYFAKKYLPAMKPKYFKFLLKDISDFLQSFRANSR